MRDGRIGVTLLGELDAASRPAFEERLYELSETAHVTIDLTVASFLDLATVRMLVACRERAKANGRFLQIVNGSEHVERLLRMLEPPLRTTPDAQRSRPESEQIVRLECPACGHRTFRPESSAAADCASCGVALEVIAIFRDRREIRSPAAIERRRC